MSNSFGCEDKNFELEIRFIKTLCKKEEVTGQKVIFNRTVDVFLTYDSHKANEQVSFSKKNALFIECEYFHISKLIFHALFYLI